MVLELAKSGKEMLPLKQRDVRETSGVTSQPTIGNFTDSQHTHADAPGGGATTHAAGDGSDHADVATNTTAVALNTTHRGSNGTDHANVGTNTTAIALNTTHRGSNGTDHANVGTNTANIATNVTAIGLNTTHRSSNGSDHSLIANKTSYWSCTGANFLPNEPDANDVTLLQDGVMLANAVGIQFIAQVNLPHGAVVTGCIGYGNTAAEAETWTLNRITISPSSSESVMATANFNTADTSISNATIDNSQYGYSIHSSGIDTNDAIRGVVITYTTDYI